MYPIFLIGNTLVFLLVVMLLFMRKRETAFSPMVLYLAFHFAVFVLRPWAEWAFQLNAVWFYLGYLPSVAERINTLMVASVALIAIVAGYLVGMQGSKRLTTGFAFTKPTKQEIKALRLVLFLIVPLVLYSLWQTRSGIGLSDQANQAMEIRDNVIINTESTGYVTDIQNAILGLVALSLIFKKFRMIVLAVLALYIARKIFTGGGRWGIVLPLASYTLLFMRVKGYKWPPARAVFFAVPILFLFVALGEDRQVFSKLLEGNAQEVKVKSGAGFRERLDGPDFANFEYLTYVLSIVPERSGTFTYGTQYLQLFTEPIPRILWQGKPAGAPIKLVDLNSYGNFFGLTVSLPGDLWMSFGWIGILAGGAFVGFIFGRCYRGFLSGRWGSFMVAAYVMGMPLLIQLFRDGGVVSFTKFFGIIIFPVLLVKLLSRQSRKRINRVQPIGA